MEYLSLREIARRAGRSPETVAKRCRTLLPAEMLVSRAEKSAPASIPEPLGVALVPLLRALPGEAFCQTVRDPEEARTVAAALLAVAEAWEQGRGNAISA